MSSLSPQELRSLSEHEQTGCVSIFLPTQAAGPMIRQSSVRLKNALKQAEEGLIRVGLRPAEAAARLTPAQRLVADDAFWIGQSKGLAIFLDTDFERILRLPFGVEEQVVVADRFHLKPLLPLLIDNARFFLLALDANGARLFEGSRFQIEERRPEGLPESLAEALRYDKLDAQYHVYTAGQTAITYGHGPGTDGILDEKDRLLRYFRKIDEALSHELSGQQAPLLLAGVDYYFPIYREANTYRHLEPEGLAIGSVANLSPAQLHECAWERLAPRFSEDARSALDIFRALNGTGRGTTDLGRILPTAYHGGIDTLFVPLNRSVWGRYDPEEGVVSVHDKRRPGDEDLLGTCSIQAFLSGARVYSVDPADMPEGGNAAAILRRGYDLVRPADVA